MKNLIKQAAKRNFRQEVILYSFSFLLLILFSCANVQKNTENLLGASFNYEKQEISIDVVTSGCTAKSDFNFTVSNNSITVIRNKKDECKAMPEVARFFYSFKDAGINPDKTYTIINKFIANPNLARITN